MNEPSVRILPVPNGAKAILTMTFDDGDLATAKWLDREFETYGLCGSCMLIVGRNIGDTFTENNPKAEAYREVFSHGRLEPQAHTMTHAPTPALAWAQGEKEKFLLNNNRENYVYELVRSKEVLQRYFSEYDILTMSSSNNTLSRCSFVQENGELCRDEKGNFLTVADGGAEKVAKENYYAIRQGVRGNQSTDPACDNDEGGSWRSLKTHRFSDRGGTVAGAVSWLDSAIADGAWLITLCHHIKADSGDFDFEKADAFFARCAESVKDGSLVCMKFSDAVKYIRERQNAVLTVGEDGKTLTLTLKERTADGLRLPYSVFNYPLSVEAETPDGKRLLTLRPGETAVF